VQRILEPSPDRVEPPCPHYDGDRCGGCQLQHLAPDAQRDAKAGIVRDAITRIGKRQADAPAVEPSPEQWRYRNKLTLALRRREGRWVAGLHPYDAPGAVFALRDCLITADTVIAVWRSILAAAEWLPDEPSLRGAVRVADGTASFVLEGGTAWPRSGDFFGAVQELAGLWWVPEGESRRLLHARGEAASPAFGQVNPAMAEVLRAHVLQRIAARNPRTVIDAYGGEGTLSAALDASRLRLTMIELDDDAVARARARLAPAVRIVHGRVEETIASALPADLVILNPPRAGLDPRVPERLAHLPDDSRPAILYVSCDPATLARDIARLPGYRIASLRAFDMFPQTAHVETVCELVPA
jgi:23S rRNA (uracil1939-C5)-methyltransferase